MRDADVVDVRGLRGGAVHAPARRDAGVVVQGGGVAELGPVAHDRADVEDGLLADVDLAAEGDPAGADAAGACLVAEEEGVLADDRAVPDGQQVGADRDGVGQDRDALADAGAEGAQVEDVDRVAGEQDHRVGVQQGLDRPEPDVREAPDRELGLLPAAHENPLGHHRHRADTDEHRAAEYRGAQIDLHHAVTRGNPFVALPRDDPGEHAIQRENQELKHSAQQIAARAPGRRRLGLNRRDGFGCVGECGCQTADRGISVDVPHRHRRQILALSHPGAEMCHDQRVGAQVVEEVAVEGYRFLAYDTGQDLREDGLGHGAGFSHHVAPWC